MLLVGLSWALGGWKTSHVELAAAMERTAFDHPDFEAGQWLASKDGSAAMALSADARELVVVFPNGDRLVTRRGPPQAFDVQFNGDLFSFDVGDAFRRRMKARAADAAAAAFWIAKLQSRNDQAG